MFLNISVEIARLLSPWLRDLLSKLVSITLQWFSNFHELRPLSKDSQRSWPLLINKNTKFWPLPLLVAPSEPLRGLQGDLSAPLEKP